MNQSDFSKISSHLWKAHEVFMESILPNEVQTCFKNKEKELLRHVQSLVNERLNCLQNDTEKPQETSRSIIIKDE